MKKAILFIGLPGSGKTTYIQNQIFGYRIVSADEIKYSYSDWDPKNPEKTHQRSVKDAENLMKKYSDEGVDICMDSGGVNNSYSFRIINMLKSKGYYVELIYMDTPLDVCLERNRMRNREVPEYVVIEKSHKLQDCLVKQLGIVDNLIHVLYEEN